MNKVDQPIGIFDSGIGGLTVAAEVKKMLPSEQIIYFGDLAHLPYGDKSSAAIQAYSIKICDFLLSKGCKVILMACNSASSAAYELVLEYVGSRALVVNVVDPVVNYFRDCDLKSIGLIGTKRTVESGVYSQKLGKINPKLTLHALATPLLVPMIEEGFYLNRISDEIIKEYLNREELKDIDALILGCTHYPVIQDQIDRYYDESGNGHVRILDSAKLVTDHLRCRLEHENLTRKTDAKAMDEFYSSDITDSFEKATAIFFGKEIHMDKYVLWE